MKKTIEELRAFSKEELIKEIMKNREPIDVGFTISFGCQPFGQHDAEVLRGKLEAFLAEQGFSWTYLEMYRE